MGLILLEKVLEAFPDWEAAIADAETKALEAEQRAVRLRAVADVFRRKKEAGEPWPGKSINTQLAQYRPFGSMRAPRKKFRLCERGASRKGRAIQACP
jgi:hypothetical protein